MGKGLDKIDPHWGQCSQCNCLTVSLLLEERRPKRLTCSECKYSDTVAGWEKSWKDRWVAEAEESVRGAVAAKKAFRQSGLGA